MMKSFHLTKEDYGDIKQMLGMRKVVEFYGYPVDRQGRCLCPFHRDQHPSMKIYPHDKGFYCFSCGLGGDVIKFVSQLYDLRNEEAAMKLIEDFSLPVKTENLSYREKRERELRVRHRRELEQFIRYAGGVLGIYRGLLCEAAREPGSSHFTEALQELSKTEYRLQCLKDYPQEFCADRKAVGWVGTVRNRIIGWYGQHETGSAVSG